MFATQMLVFGSFRFLICYKIGLKDNESVPGIPISKYVKKKSLLGLLGYYSKFIKLNNFVATPFVKLL
jgi:hypothetical protein